MRGYDDLPLHIPPLGATQSKDAVLCENIKTQWVNALLVDYDEILLLLRRVHGLVTDEVLELDDLFAFRVGEAPFRFYELLALLCGRVEEA